MAISKIQNGQKGLEVRTILNKMVDSVNTLESKDPVKLNITPEMIAQATDNGVAPNSGSVKGLGEGWWVIPEANTGITGRPKGSQGDLIYFRQGVGHVGSRGGTSYSVSWALGKNKDNEDTLWVAYRDGTAWTSWWPIRNISGSTIPADIAALKAGNTQILERISKLETDLGNIFAPTQSAFDTEVTKLINAKLAPPLKDIENLFKLHTVFTYKDRISPSFPVDTAYGGYYITLYDLTATTTISPPKPSMTLADGTVLVIENQDTNNSIKLTSNTGETVNNGQTYGLPAGNFAMLVKVQTDWKLLYSGYFPSSLSDIVTAIETNLKNKGWGPLSGKPSGGSPDLPQQPLPKIVVMFHDALPTSLADDTAVTSTNGEAQLQRTEATPMRIWVLVENNNDEADRVKTISVNGGIPAVWQPRDLVLNGDKYRGFYSAGGYTETQVSVKVNFE